MLIDGFKLVKCCRKLNFDVSGERTIIFAIRGCLPLSVKVDPAEAGYPAQQKLLGETRVNYREAACTIGIWYNDTGSIAVFPGSTVPSLHYLHQHPGSEKHFNILCPGRYRVIKGLHPRKTGGYQKHNALVMPGQGWVMKPALIRKRGMSYFDFKETGFRVDYPGDNIHASRSEPYISGDDPLALPVMDLRFSSSGCLTIAGQPGEYVKGSYPVFWNYWEQFIQLLYNSTTADTFSLLLFNFSDFVDEQGDNSSGYLRYGSGGADVLELQAKLSEIICSSTGNAYYTGNHDGSMEGETVKAYLRFMNDFLPGKATGEVNIDRFRAITCHFLFTNKYYSNVIN